ncbi:hypothetical protein LXL04_027816 [Taraxacum kok-saghyz]
MAPCAIVYFTTIDEKATNGKSTPKKFTTYHQLMHEKVTDHIMNKKVATKRSMIFTKRVNRSLKMQLGKNCNINTVRFLLSNKTTVGGISKHSCDEEEPFCTSNSSPSPSVHLRGSSNWIQVNFVKTFLREYVNQSSKIGSQDLLRTHIFPRTRELPQFPISPKLYRILLELKKKWGEQVYSENFDIRKGNINIEWFKGGITNICYNCLDKNIESGNGDKIALHWEGNEPGVDDSLTYNQLLDKVSQLANYLKENGVRKGDSVIVYLPMLMELPITMLACARIGAVHSVVFAGFSADSLVQRIMDCKPKIRQKKVVNLKDIVDSALSESSQNGVSVGLCLTYANESAMKKEATKWQKERDAWWQKLHNAVEILKEMEDSGTKPDSVTYNTLISYFTQNNDLDTTHKFLKQMVKDGNTPTVVTYGALIHAYCTSGNLDEGLNLFEEMTKTSNVVPNNAIYNILIDSLCKSGKVDHGLSLMDGMLEKGIRPNTTTFNAILKGLSSRNRVKDADRVMNLMKSQGCYPDYITMEILNDWFYAIGEVDKLKQFVEGFQTTHILNFEDVVAFKIKQRWEVTERVQIAYLTHQDRFICPSSDFWYSFKVYSRRQIGFSHALRRFGKGFPPLKAGLKTLGMTGTGLLAPTETLRLGCLGQLASNFLPLHTTSFNPLEMSSISA